MKTRKRAGRKSAALEAIRLLGQWNRIALGHVQLASGCSCGTGVGALPVKSFERDILDYLYARHGERPSATISEMLTSIAKQQDLGSIDRNLALLADLTRSIESFGGLHNRAR
jgi:hypothetical protein